MIAILRSGAAAVVALGICFSAVAETRAQAADSRVLLERIDRLERDLQIMQRQLYRGEGGGVPSSPPRAPIETREGSGAEGGGGGTFNESLLVRMADLERQVTELTGRLEQAQFGAAQAKEQIDRLTRDSEFRFSQIEQRLSAAPPAAQTDATAPFGDQPMAGGETGAPAGAPADAPAGGAAPSSAAQVALPPGTPEQQYNYARAFLAKADYPAAEKALKLFLKSNPEGDLAGNAMYWLGETYYVREDYAQAAATFIQGYQKYPNNSKAADNLLKLGLALGRSGKKDDACTAFKLLDSKFPNALEVLKRRATAEKQKLGCK